MASLLNPNRNNICHHLDILRRNLNLYSAEYLKFVIIGDFNTEVTEASTKRFCNSYELKKLIKETTTQKPK